MLETIIKSLSYLFLAGVLLVFISAAPRVRALWPRAFLLGFAISVTSAVLVLVTALLLA